MLKVTDLSYEFPQKDLYHKISFSIEDGQHCVLIGTNGTGKSTLIRILAHPDEYLYDGKIEMEANQRIGFVNQFLNLADDEDCSVFSYIKEPFDIQQKKIDDICKEMEAGENIEALMEQYQEAWDLFTAMDGDNCEVNIKKQLKLAGLEKLENLKMTELSGGECKLIEIIRQMLVKPSLLIMDEPDAFLDFENVNALRDLINAHKGTLLVITHNRYLLNYCFDKVLHLENKEIERNRKLVEKLRRNATRFDNASLGKALHARVSLLERLENRKTRSPFIEIPHPQIVLHTDAAVDEVEQPVLKVEDYEVRFDELLLEHVSFELAATDKVAIVGGNGTGKTTLLREIYRRQNPAIAVAADTDVAYLSQMQGETMDEQQSVWEAMEQVGMEKEDEAAAYLLTYGLPKEILEQKIHALSGGEKNLLQLAILSLGNASLLLMDEPTSHLDLYAQEALEEAVAAYNGAVLMVSHDFYTIANCVDYVLYVEDKTVRKVSARKFRKMIYANHFDKDYLELEKKKKELEGRIYQALTKDDPKTAEQLSEKLADVIGKMDQKI